MRMMFDAAIRCAVIAASVQAFPAWAETPRKLAMGQIAGVAAIASLCPTLKPNFSALSSVAIPYSIDMTEGSEDWLWIQEKMKKTIVMFMQSGGEIMACGTGKTLYGPGGLDVPNLMLSE